MVPPCGLFVSAHLCGLYKMPVCVAHSQCAVVWPIFSSISWGLCSGLCLWTQQELFFSEPQKNVNRYYSFWRHCLGISSLFCSPGPASMCQKRTGSDKAASQRQGLSYQQCDCLSQMHRRKSWHFDMPGKPDKEHRGLCLPAIVIH